MIRGDSISSDLIFDSRYLVPCAWCVCNRLESVSIRCSGFLGTLIWTRKPTSMIWWAFSSLVYISIFSFGSVTCSTSGTERVIQADMSVDSLSRKLSVFRHFHWLSCSCSIWNSVLVVIETVVHDPGITVKEVVTWFLVASVLTSSQSIQLMSCHTPRAWHCVWHPQGSRGTFPVRERSKYGTRQIWDSQVYFLR